MAVTSVAKDYERLTVTLIAEFAASIGRVWELWADPRQLERSWGPPGYPATFAIYDLTPGGEARYFLTGPEGRMWGAWRVRTVEPPIALEFVNVFADPDGTPVGGMPVFTATVRLSERDGVTRMELHLAFESREEMEWMVSMGTVDGVAQAVSQIDALLA